MNAGQPRPHALVAAVVTLLMGGASGGCDREARPIRNEFQALFDERPVVTVVPCPDGEQAASPSTQQCLNGDGSDRSKQTATLAGVYLDKAEALLARGDAAAGWQHALDGLALYAKPKPFALPYFVSAGSVLDRVRSLLARFPAAPSTMARLRVAAADAFMPRPEFCAGLRLQMLFELYRAFHDALAPLRPRVTERWGKPIADTLATGNRGDMAVWRASRAFYDQLLDGCNHSSVPLLLPLDYDTRPGLSAFPPASPAKAQAELALKQLREYSDATDAFLVFFVDIARLTQLAAGKPADAETLTKLVLVPSLPMPLQNQWDGSMPELADAPRPPGGLIVKRSELQRTLAPPAAPRR